MTACERCGYKPDTWKRPLNDYCAVCAKTLCRTCLTKGCCGIVPARSGTAEDYGEQEESGR